MLGWITGQTERPTDGSVVMEPPETPAPVFAARAFKSYIFGTPAGEDNDDARPAGTKSRGTPVVLKRNTIRPTIETATVRQQSKEKSSSDPGNQLSVSPTKSILVTPGTTSNRRKTVSFGDTAIHEDPEVVRILSRSNSAAPSSAGSVTSQWMASQSDGKSRPRSKLTQSLHDAKDHHAEELPIRVYTTNEESSPNGESKTTAENHDETIDIDDPRSQSGQYWKTEFENYRKKTSFEIARLVQYRMAAKSYARKKDVEAMRLTAKLRKEEEKVAEMERRVTGLASDMMNKDVDVDREELVQDLTKQTALAVQYKHKVDTLRKTLERHGVVGSQDDQTDSEGSSREDRAEISRLQQALDEANKKLEEKSHDDEMRKLRDLAKSSEDKVSQIEKENAILKQTIARVKTEMGKYEERRFEKETKLKQRASKWEARCQEYKDKMRGYQTAVHGERQSYQQEIRALKEELASLRISNTRISVNGAHQNPDEKSYAGIQVHDFGDLRSNIPVDSIEEDEKENVRDIF